MNNTDTSNNATPAAILPPAPIREQIKENRTFAAILTAPAVLVVLDRFDGKLVNARLWHALTEAAKTVDPGALFAAPDWRYSVVASIRVQHYAGQYAAGLSKREVYDPAPGEQRKTAPGVRLDAAAVREIFAADAARLATDADQLEEQGARFAECLADLRAIGAAARAFCDKWRPEFRHALALDAGDALHRVAQLDRASVDSFARFA